MARRLRALPGGRNWRACTVCRGQLDPAAIAGLPSITWHSACECATCGQPLNRHTAIHQPLPATA